MEEHRKNSSFRKGLLSGILLAVLAFGLTGCAAARLLPGFWVVEVRMTRRGLMPRSKN